MTTSLRKDIDRMRSYSSAFSRKVFNDILLFNDFSQIDWIYHQYDKASRTFDTYLNYFKYIYSLLIKKYRCEYVYKNEIINKVLLKLLKSHGTRDTVAFNEFKVGKSIVDIAFFNGESKAFEIKTDLDSSKRLPKQIEDYKKLFDKCYIVIPENKYEYYEESVEPEIGILVLSKNNGKIKIQTSREALRNEMIDSDVLINCLRTEEYKRLVTSEIGHVPDVPGANLYDYCKGVIETLPVKRLKSFFLDAIKTRKNNTNILSASPQELRQICLSLELSLNNINTLIANLNNTIN